MAEDEIELDLTTEDDLLDMIDALRLRVCDIESGKSLGEYIPTDEDEKRRAWVMSIYVSSDISIDINLEQMHKATEWLKSGKLPRKKKFKDEEDGGEVLQLVKS